MKPISSGPSSTPARRRHRPDGGSRTGFGAVGLRGAITLVAAVTLSGCAQVEDVWDDLWDPEPEPAAVILPVGPQVSSGFPNYDSPYFIPGAIPGAPPQQAPLSPPPLPSFGPVPQPAPYATMSAIHLGAFRSDADARQYAAQFWGRQPAVLQGINAQIVPQRTDRTGTVFNLFGVTDSWSRAQLACNQFQARRIYCGVVSLPVARQNP